MINLLSIYSDEEQILGLDVLYYKMLKVSLSAIVSNRSDSLVRMEITNEKFHH